MTASTNQFVATSPIAKLALTITPFHKDLFAAMVAGRKAHGTMLEKMQALLKSKYGATMPSYVQAKGDRAALKALADEKGLADDQWMRKPYNLAVKALYGDLPASTSAAALAKAKAREASPKAGAKKGETAPRRTSNPESLEQYIARIGVFKVLEQCVLILESDEATHAAAKAVRTTWLTC